MEKQRRALRRSPASGRALMQRLLQRIIVHLFATDHFHGLPIVGKFSAAIQTDYVRPGDTGSFRPPILARDGETVILVPATEKHIDQTRHHLPHPLEGPTAEWFCPELLAPGT